MKLSSVQEFLDALVQVRDVVGQSAFVADSGFPPSQELIEELSALIREWLPKDRQFAEVLAEEPASLPAVEGLRGPCHEQPGAMASRA